MKMFTFVMAIFMINNVSAESSSLEHIRELVWENRIILLQSTTDDQRNEAILKQYNEQIIDRDIIWFIVNDRGVVTNYDGFVSSDFITKVKSDYPINRDKVLLIGKDGGIKARNRSLDIEYLFTKIDGMSMRQQEMRNNN